MTERSRKVLKVLVTGFYTVFGIGALIAYVGGVNEATQTVSKGELPDVVGGVFGLIVCHAIFGCFAYWSARRLVAIWRE